MIILTAYKVDAHNQKSLNGDEIKIFQFWRPLDKEGYSMNWLQIHDPERAAYFEEYHVIQPYRRAYHDSFATEYFVQWWKDSVLIEAPERIKLFR